MKAVYWFVGAALVILVIDCAIGTFLEWRKRRDMRKWCFSPSAFKPVRRNWWEA